MTNEIRELNKVITKLNTKVDKLEIIINSKKINSRKTPVDKIDYTI